MQKEYHVSPKFRTHFLSRVNRYGVVIKVTDFFDNVKVYDAVKLPQKYVQAIVDDNNNVQSVEVRLSTSTKYHLCYSRFKNVNFNWNEFLAPVKAAVKSKQMVAA